MDLYNNDFVLTISGFNIYPVSYTHLVADFIGESNILNGTMIHDKLVRFCGTEFECVDEGFGENVPVCLLYTSSMLSVTRLMEVRTLKDRKWKLVVRL